jgi:VWFA-related protein
MSRSLALSLIALAACGLAQEAAFKAGVSIVEVDAQVVDRAGVIEGLQQRDFVIKDNRSPVPLRYCVLEETPLDLVLLFELSKAMAPKLAQLRLASEMALAEIHDRDRVGVLSFDQDVRVEQSLTSDLKEVKRRLRIGLANARFGKSPFVLPAVEKAGRYLSAQPEPHGRRAVLIFTGDAGFGLENQNHLAVAKDLWEADTFLSAMVIPNTLTRITSDDNPFHFHALLMLGFNLWDSVDDIAEQTGGEVVYAEAVGPIHQTENPYSTLRLVIRRMRRRYKLYYDMPPGKPGQSRRIDIALSPAAQTLHPDARIIGRRGYVIPRQATQ